MQDIESQEEGDAKFTWTTPLSQLEQSDKRSNQNDGCNQRRQQVTLPDVNHPIIEDDHYPSSHYVSTNTAQSQKNNGQEMLLYTTELEEIEGRECDTFGYPKNGVSKRNEENSNKIMQKVRSKQPDLDNNYTVKEVLKQALIIQSPPDKKAIQDSNNNDDEILDQIESKEVFSSQPLSKEIEHDYGLDFGSSLINKKQNSKYLQGFQGVSTQNRDEQNLNNPQNFTKFNNIKGGIYRSLDQDFQKQVIQAGKISSQQNQYPSQQLPNMQTLYQQLQEQVSIKRKKLTHGRSAEFKPRSSRVTNSSQKNTTSQQPIAQNIAANVVQNKEGQATTEMIESIRSPWLSHQKSSNVLKTSSYCLSMSLSASSQSKPRITSTEQMLIEEEEGNGGSDPRISIQNSDQKQKYQQTEEEMCDEIDNVSEIEDKTRRAAELRKNCVSRSPQKNAGPKNMHGQTEMTSNDSWSRANQSPTNSKSTKIHFDDNTGRRHTSQSFKNNQEQKNTKKPFNSPMLLASAASNSASSPVSATDEALGQSEEFRVVQKRNRLESFDSVSQQQMNIMGTNSLKTTTNNAISPEDNHDYEPIKKLQKFTDPQKLILSHKMQHNALSKNTANFQSKSGEIEPHNHMQKNHLLRENQSSSQLSYLLSKSGTSKVLDEISKKESSWIVGAQVGSSGFQSGENLGNSQATLQQIKRGNGFVRDSIPQVLSFVSQKLINTSSSVTNELYRGPTPAGTNTHNFILSSQSGHGSILNQFITEDADEEEDLESEKQEFPLKTSEGESPERRPLRKKSDEFLPPTDKILIESDTRQNEQSKSGGSQNQQEKQAFIGELNQISGNKVALATNTVQNLGQNDDNILHIVAQQRKPSGSTSNEFNNFGYTNQGEQKTDSLVFSGNSNHQIEVFSSNTPLNDEEVNQQNEQVQRSSVQKMEDQEEVEEVPIEQTRSSEQTLKVRASVPSSTISSPEQFQSQQLDDDDESQVASCNYQHASQNVNVNQEMNESESQYLNQEQEDADDGEEMGQQFSMYDESSGFQMFAQGDCETGEDMIGEGLLSSTNLNDDGLETTLRTCKDSQNENAILLHSKRSQLANEERYVDDMEEIIMPQQASDTVEQTKQEQTVQDANKIMAASLTTVQAFQMINPQHAASSVFDESVPNRPLNAESGATQEESNQMAHQNSQGALTMNEQAELVKMKAKGHMGISTISEDAFSLEEYQRSRVKDHVERFIRQSHELGSTSFGGLQSTLIAKSNKKSSIRESCQAQNQNQGYNQHDQSSYYLDGQQVVINDQSAIKSSSIGSNGQFVGPRLNRWSLQVEENQRNQEYFKNKDGLLLEQDQEEAPYSSSFKQRENNSEVESGQLNSYIARLNGQSNRIGDIYNNSAPFIDNTDQEEEQEEDNVPSQYKESNLNQMFYEDRPMEFEDLDQHQTESAFSAQEIQESCNTSQRRRRQQSLTSKSKASEILRQASQEKLQRQFCLNPTSLKGSTTNHNQQNNDQSHGNASRNELEIVSSGTNFGQFSHHSSFQNPYAIKLPQQSHEVAQYLLSGSEQDQQIQQVVSNGEMAPEELQYLQQMSQNYCQNQQTIDRSSQYRLENDTLLKADSTLQGLPQSNQNGDLGQQSKPVVIEDRSYDVSAAEYDCADADMDGPESVCIDQLILEQNRQRVQDMRIGKPLLVQLRDGSETQDMKDAFVVQQLQGENHRLQQANFEQKSRQIQKLNQDAAKMLPSQPEVKTRGLSRQKQESGNHFSSAERQQSFTQRILSEHSNVSQKLNHDNHTRAISRTEASPFSEYQLQPHQLVAFGNGQTQIFKQMPLQIQPNELKRMVDQNCKSKESPHEIGIMGTQFTQQTQINQMSTIFESLSFDGVQQNSKELLVQAIQQPFFDAASRIDKKDISGTTMISGVKGGNIFSSNSKIESKTPAQKSSLRHTPRRPDDVFRMMKHEIGVGGNSCESRQQQQTLFNQADLRKTGEKKLRKLSEQLPTQNCSSSNINKSSLRQTTMHQDNNHTQQFNRTTEVVEQFHHLNPSSTTTNLIQGHKRLEQNLKMDLQEKQIVDQRQNVGNLKLQYIPRSSEQTNFEQEDTEKMFGYVTGIQAKNDTQKQDQSDDPPNHKINTVQREIKAQQMPTKGGISIHRSPKIDFNHLQSKDRRSTELQLPTTVPSQLDFAPDIDHYTTQNNVLPNIQSSFKNDQEHHHDSCCKNCKVEQNKTTQTKTAFKKAMKMTQYLMNEIERLKTDRNNQKNHSVKRSKQQQPVVSKSSSHLQQQSENQKGVYSVKRKNTGSLQSSNSQNQFVQSSNQWYNECGKKTNPQLLQQHFEPNIYESYISTQKQTGQQTQRQQMDIYKDSKIVPSSSTLQRSSLLQSYSAHATDFAPTSERQSKRKSSKKESLNNPPNLVGVSQTQTHHQFHPKSQHQLQQSTQSHNKSNLNNVTQPLAVVSTVAASQQQKTNRITTYQQYNQVYVLQQKGINNKGNEKQLMVKKGKKKVKTATNSYVKGGTGQSKLLLS